MPGGMADSDPELSDIESSGDENDEGFVPTIPVAKPRKKKNLSHSIRKSIGSQVASSKVGRHVIQNYVGTEGNSIINALKTAQERHSGKSTAKEQKHLMFKFVVKITLMAREGLINPDNSKVLVQPLINLKKTILKALNAENENPDVEKLIDAFNDVHQALHKLTSPFMKPSNVKKLDTLFETMSNREFVEKLVGDPAYKDDKAEILKAVKVLVAFEDFPYEPKEHLLSERVMRNKYGPVVQTLQIYFKKVAEKEKEITKLMVKSWSEKFPGDDVLFLRATLDPHEGAKLILGLCCMMVENLYDTSAMIEEVRKFRLENCDIDVPVEKYDQTRWTLDYAISIILKNYPIRVRVTWKVAFQFMLWMMFEDDVAKIKNDLSSSDGYESKEYESDENNRERKESRHAHKISQPQLDAKALLVEFGVVKDDDDIFAESEGKHGVYEPTLDTLSE